MAVKAGLSIAVEGVIGVGKTTLAQALAAALRAELVLESAIPNPFLDRFYQDQRRHALACQLCFLEGRLRQLAALRPGRRALVADYVVEKDRLFAAVNLEEEEWRLYQRYYELMRPGVDFAPQVVIYLKAGLDELRRRIRNRGRPLEAAISPAYLAALIEAYDKHFARVADRRVVVVDTDSTDIARSPVALRCLIDACRQAPPGLSYCNPEV